VIQDASQNVVEKFKSEDFFSFDDTRILINDLFENLVTYTNEEM
jgi:hypothetical protein